MYMSMCVCVCVCVCMCINLLWYTHAHVWLLVCFILKVIFAGVGVGGLLLLFAVTEVYG